MLDSFVRQAYHFDLHLKPTPEEADLIFFKQIIDEFVILIKSGEAVYLREKGTSALRIRECKYDQNKNILFLLINFSDTKVTDPAFENLETGKLRVEPKLQGEGVAISTHMAIDLIPAKDRSPTYRAYLEDVPGIGRTKLIPFLTAMIRKGCKPIPWTDPAGKVKKSRASVSLVGSLNLTLKKDLEKGRLSTIELVKYNVKSKFDEEDRVEEEKRSIKLRVVKDKNNPAIDIIKSVRDAAKKEGYTEMKVGYTRESGKFKTTKFGSAREDVGDVLTVKVSEIALTNPRKQCEDKLRADIVKKLDELVVSERN